MYDVKKLREEFASIHAEAGNVIAAAAKDSRELSGEEKEAQAKRYARLDAIKAQIDEGAKFASYKLDAGEVILPKAPAGRDEYEANANREQFANAGDKFDLDAFKRGLNLYAQTGDTRQLFATTTATGSGAYLPKAVGLATQVRRLSNAFRSAIDAMGYSPIELPNTSAFSLPVGDDTANTGQSQSEGATSGTVLDETDASLSFSPTLYSSKQKWFSNTMVLANGFDVLAYVVPMLQKRLEKIQESAWTTVLKTQTVGKTLAATTGITYAELLAWEHSLAPAYRSDAVFMVSDSLYQALRGLVDDQHRPILDLDPTNTFVGKIHGKPVIINDYLDDMTANHKVGAFVSADAIKIVDCVGQRLIAYTNVPSYPDQKGYEIVTNGDCQFVAKGVALLRTAIS